MMIKLGVAGILSSCAGTMSCRSLAAAVAESLKARRTDGEICAEPRPTAPSARVPPKNSRRESWWHTAIFVFSNFGTMRETLHAESIDQCSPSTMFSGTFRFSDITIVPVLLHTCSGNSCPTVVQHQHLAAISATCFCPGIFSTSGASRQTRRPLFSTKTKRALAGYKNCPVLKELRKCQGSNCHSPHVWDIMQIDLPQWLCAKLPYYGSMSERMCYEQFCTTQ